MSRQSSEPGVSSRKSVGDRQLSSEAFAEDGAGRDGLEDRRWFDWKTASPTMTSRRLAAVRTGPTGERRDTRPSRALFNVAWNEGAEDSSAFRSRSRALATSRSSSLAVIVLSLN
jgi:hypothetical protein